MVGSLVALILSLGVLLGFVALSLDYLDSKQTAPTPQVVNIEDTKNATATPVVVHSKVPEVQVRRGATTAKIEQQSPSHVGAPGPLEADVSLRNGALTVSGVLAYTNLARQQNGDLKPLAINQTLNTIAMHKLDDMFAQQYFEHISPTGIGPSELAQQYGYDYIYVAENLAQGNFDNDAKLVGAWMTSAGHRANILNPRYQEIGIAIKQGDYKGKKVWIAVQTFGRATASCPSIDQALHENIEKHNAELARIAKELDVQKTNLDALTEEDAQGYAEALKKYELAIDAFNAFVAETDALIKTYNTQVRTYNTCVTIE